MSCQILYLSHIDGGLDGVGWTSVTGRAGDLSPNTSHPLLLMEIWIGPSLAAEVAEVCHI